MADVKISQLTALASASSDVAADVLAIVDTSVPQTKKITIENLVAPITLDKSNSRVGIGDSSPSYTLEVKGNIGIQRSTNTEVSEITMEAGQFDIKASPYGYAHRFFNGTGGTSTEKLQITTEGRVIQKNTSLANSCFDIVNGSSSGYGLYIKAGNSTNYALAVNSYDNFGILEAKLNTIDFKRAGTFRIGYGNSADYDLSIKQNVSSGLVKYTFDVRNNGTDYANNLVLDRGKVGIGDTSPTTAKLSISHDDASDANALYLYNPNTGANAKVNLNFGLERNASAVKFIPARLQAGKEQEWTGTASTVDGYLSFQIVQNETITERMRIKSDGLVQINQNNAGSAGTSNKSLSLGGAVSTQFDRTNVGTMTGIVVSNSYGDSGGSSNPTQSGTATGIVFTHHTSSSGISYIASVSGSQNGDRSALHFGTRGSSGVKERFMLNDNGEVKIGHGGDGYLYHYQINSNAHVWTIYAHSDDSYRFNRNGSGSDEMRIESDGDVVILGNLTQNSDIRLKENIETIPNALSKVNQLRGVTYNWNETSGRDTEAKQIGMIADEVEEILPELVKVDSAKGSFDEDGLDNIKSLKYGNVVGLLIEAVKELSAKVEALENA